MFEPKGGEEQEGGTFVGEGMRVRKKMGCSAINGCIDDDDGHRVLVPTPFL